ncbi:MAG: hypothetical protein PF448_03775 [Bacteroidales bacterium]|nr:hypothetical protein [Bacteroidales bacterium]
MDKILGTNLNAILVTVVIHLVLLFVFLLVQLKPPQQQNEAIIIMDPENLEEMERFFEAEEAIKEKMEELAKSQDISLEDIRNLSTNSKLPENKTWNEEYEKMSAEALKQQYEDALRKEMYGEDYDEINQKLNETAEIQEFDFSPDAEQADKKGNQNYYSGPALVKVELEDRERNHVYIDIPVFVCRGAGTIVVEIEIDQYGKVSKTKVAEAQASQDLDCMINEAVRAAEASIFGIKTSEKSTKGKITYQFIQQN